jgi:uroporphyrinogen decarboxylase
MVGPKLRPIRTEADISSLHTLDPVVATPFVGETLKQLRQEVSKQTTVLGFVGAPFTLASYMVEGGSSSDFRYLLYCCCPGRVQ